MSDIELRPAGHRLNAGACRVLTHTGRRAIVCTTASARGARVIPGRLFVVSDAAALIADARCKRLLESRLSRFRKIIIHRGHGSFRRALNCVKGSLAYRVVAKFKGANINAYHAGTWERCEFAVGGIEAGNIKIPVVKLLVVRITDCAQRRGPVALERDDGAVKHRLRFLCRPELLGTGQGNAQSKRQCRQRRRKQRIAHGILA